VDVYRCAAAVAEVATVACCHRDDIVIIICLRRLLGLSSY